MPLVWEMEANSYLSIPRAAIFMMAAVNWIFSFQSKFDPFKIYAAS